MLRGHDHTGIAGKQIDGFRLARLDRKRQSLRRRREREPYTCLFCCRPDIRKRVQLPALDGERERRFIRVGNGKVGRRVFFVRLTNVLRGDDPGDKLAVCLRASPAVGKLSGKGVPRKPERQLRAARIGRGARDEEQPAVDAGPLPAVVGLLAENGNTPLLVVFRPEGQLPVQSRKRREMLPRRQPANVAYHSSICSCSNTGQTPLRCRQAPRLR